VVESCSREVATRAESGPDGCTAWMVYNHVKDKLLRIKEQIADAIIALTPRQGSLRLSYVNVTYTLLTS